MDGIPITDARSLDLSSKYEFPFIQPSKPVVNAFIEGVNGRWRDGGLVMHHATSLAEGQMKNETWRRDEK